MVLKVPISITPYLINLMDGGQWVSIAYGTSSSKVAHGPPSGSTDRMHHQMTHLGPHSPKLEYSPQLTCV